MFGWAFISVIRSNKIRAAYRSVRIRSTEGKRGAPGDSGGAAEDGEEHAERDECHGGSEV